MPNKIDIVAIGQFPPPLHGQSYITLRATEELRRGHSMQCFDLSAGKTARGARKHLLRLKATLHACFGLIQHRHESKVCYIACDGGLGMIYTIMTATLASTLGYRLFLHHHSYAYIDRANLLMQALLVLNRKAIHIFLCETMRLDFEARYKVDAQSRVVSNAAFVPPVEELSVPSRLLILGHLSNLTREKGLYLFIELLRQSISEGRNVRGVLAGPVALEADRLAIKQACQDLGDSLEYRGPVHGADKDAFYRDTEVFVFPTQYIHEAQPTVIFEALAAGCKVVSFGRGCIASQVLGDGLIVQKSDDFVARTLEWLAQIGDNVKSDRSQTIARYQARHLTELDQIRNLIHRTEGSS